MKPPDVFHAARKIISDIEDGNEDDGFLRQQFAEIKETRELQLQAHQALKDSYETYRSFVRPQKDMLLSNYRRLKKRFKDESSPILKQLDRLDEEMHKHRQEQRSKIHTFKAKERELLRSMAFYKLETIGNTPISSTVANTL